jgi:hypothetical protein
VLVNGAVAFQSAVSLGWGTFQGCTGVGSFQFFQEPGVVAEDGDRAAVFFHSQVARRLLFRACIESYPITENNYTFRQVMLRIQTLTRTSRNQQGL